METFFVLAVFFIFVTVIFVIFCVFFPEWVGITGKKASEVLEHQRGDQAKLDEDSPLEDKKKNPNDKLN